MDMNGTDVPREVILSASLDGTVDDVARALVELLHARVDAAGDIERHGAVEVLVVGVIANVSKEAIRVKRSWFPSQPVHLSIIFVGDQHDPSQFGQPTKAVTTRVHWMCRTR